MTSPSPRLAPVTRAIRDDSVICVPRFVETSTDKGPTSSALEVKGQMTQSGIVGDVLTIGEVAGAAEWLPLPCVSTRSRASSLPNGTIQGTAAIPVTRSVASPSSCSLRRSGCPSRRSACSSRDCPAIVRRNGQTGRSCPPAGRSESRAYRRARTDEGRPHRMHRLRLPLAGPMPARQSRRPCRAPRRRAALLDRAV